MKLQYKEISILMIAAAWYGCETTPPLPPPAAAEGNLVAVTEEPAGENCLNGGLAVRVGVDSDGDGTLGSEEGEAHYVCHGRGEPVPPPIPDPLEMDVVEVDDARLTYTPDGFTCHAGEWCNQAGGWSVNRLSQDGRNTECAGETDCSDNAVVLALDDNTHRSVILSHWDSPESRIIAVELSFDGGTTYSFHKAINTQRSRVQEPNTSKLHTIATNLPLGMDVRVRLVAAKGRMNVEGFALSKLILPERDDRPFRSIAWASGVRADDTCERDSGCGPTPLPDRQLIFVKTQDESDIRIQYNDNFRSFAADGNTRACQWEIYFNGTSCPSGRISGTVFADGSSLDNSHRPNTVAGHCRGLPAGVYTAQVYVGSWGPFAGMCYTGRQGDRWFIEAEEVQ